MCAALLTEALSAARLVEPSGRLELRSTAFADGGAIPERFTMYDRDISPELHWKGVPGEARSLALIVSDPDAIPVADKEWLHWAIADIPPFVDRIPETAGAQTDLPFNGRHLLNDFGDERYGGPKPPAGTGVAGVGEGGVLEVGGQGVGGAVHQGLGPLALQDAQQPVHDCVELLGRNAFEELHPLQDGEQAAASSSET
jgi:Raf kinase inhibitor-like YbhB/YbcL family protein